MTARCMAGDGYGKLRENHKPAPGEFSGQTILSCVWCGRTLGIIPAAKLGEIIPIAMQ